MSNCQKIPSHWNLRSSKVLRSLVDSGSRNKCGRNEQKLSKLKYHLHFSPSQITVTALSLHVNKLHDLSCQSPSSAGLNLNLPPQHDNSLTDAGRKRNGHANGLGVESDLVSFPTGTLGGNWVNGFVNSGWTHKNYSAEPLWNRDHIFFPLGHFVKE